MPTQMPILMPTFSAISCYNDYYYISTIKLYFNKSKCLHNLYYRCFPSFILVDRLANSQIKLYFTNLINKMKSKTMSTQQTMQRNKKPIAGTIKVINHNKSSFSLQKNSKQILKNQAQISRIQNSPNKKTKTAGPQEIQQLAEKHYNQAMKYVYKKNDVHQQMKKREAERHKLQKQKLSSEHTFQPILRNNPYNKKIELLKGKLKKNKEEELGKWGINHQAVRRQQVIRGEIEVIRSSLQKQNRSLQNSRKSSLDRSSLQRNIGGSTDNLMKGRLTQKIPGVRKYYLNQARAQVSRGSRERLMFKGNQTMGYYF